MRIPGDSGGSHGAPENSKNLILDLREHFGQLAEWAGARVKKDRGAEAGPWVKNRFRDFEGSFCAGRLAQFYVPFSISNYQRWHEKLGHPGRKILRRCHIPGLVIPKNVPPCDACQKGKMHKLGPVSGPSVKEIRENFLPGEYIMTDLQGPYVRSRNGARYSQIFVDLVSRRVWTVGLGHKTDSDEAIRKVILDARARSARPIKVLRTDGDGIFGKSSSFQKIKEEFSFVHERPPAYDHNKSAIVDRECRTLLEAQPQYCFSQVPPLQCGRKPVRILFL